MLNSSSHKRVPQEDQTFEFESAPYTTLHEAAIAGEDATVKVLLAAGADRHAKDNKHGNTALHEAAWRGYSRCVKLLCTLPQIGRVNKKKLGRKAKDVKYVEDEWRNGIYLNTPNAGGFSPLHLAAQNGHNQSCREILLAGANSDVKNNYGDTPLHTSCRYGHAGATRILISAKCDSMCVNLNYDTPMHIACAMGRRKLTRILFEVCGMNSLLVRNAQGETPRDIAFRKNLKPIIEILNLPPNLRTTTASTSNDVDRLLNEQSYLQSSSESARNQTSDNSGKIKLMKKTKHHSNTKEKNYVNKKCHDPDAVGDPGIWSPYGCHYFPDPRTFPPPKLETLPKEPLKYGEQYYLDLAGNIRKGPIGIGNTCYCGPFFNHIEQQINQNRKSFKKYVLKGTGKLDGKVQEPARHTNSKIQKISRSLMTEQHKEGLTSGWPIRNDPLRATVVPQLSQDKKSEMNNNTLSRCRSLEFLEHRTSKSKMDQRSKCTLHQSFDLLNKEEQHEVTIHHSMTAHGDTSTSSSVHHSTNTSETSEQRNPCKLDIKQTSCTLDFRENYENTIRKTLTDTESLEDFSNKTKEIIQMKRATRLKFKERTLNELRDQQRLDKSLELPLSFYRKIPTISVDSLGNLNRSPYRYPNDFDNISAEMKNITELLGASIIEPLESAPSTSSSFYKYRDHKGINFCTNDNDYDGSTTRSDTDIQIMSPYGNHSNGNCELPPFNLVHNNGFFRNTCFENQSCSSYNTMKSIELIKVENNDHVDHDDHGDLDPVEKEVLIDQNNDNKHNDDNFESIHSSDESGNDFLNLVADIKSLNKTYLDDIVHRKPRAELVTGKIKSLLSNSSDSVEE